MLRSVLTVKILSMSALREAVPDIVATSDATATQNLYERSLLYFDELWALRCACEAACLPIQLARARAAFGYGTIVKQPASKRACCVMSARHLAGVLHEVPAVQHAFAYGSGVFAQPGLYKKATRSSAMLDFIFLVDDAKSWHGEVRHCSAIIWRGSP